MMKFRLVVLLKSALKFCLKNWIAWSINFKAISKDAFTRPFYFSSFVFRTSYSQNSAQINKSAIEVLWLVSLQILHQPNQSYNDLALKLFASDKKTQNQKAGNLEIFKSCPNCLFLNLDQIDSEQTRHSIASLQRLRMAT